MKLYIHAAQDADKRDLAQNSKDPDVLAKLAEDENGFVREFVAENRNTPPEILAKLADDKDDYVRAWVAGNPNTPPEVLITLAEDGNENVRRNVVNNSNTPLDPEILAQLASDEDKNVRWSVAENPNTPLEILAELAEDENSGVRYGVTQNPNISPEILTQLAGDEDASVRLGVAQNPNTPPEIKSKLNPKKSSEKVSWKSIINQIEDELDSGIDPLYEQTDAGEYIENLQEQVENKLGVWLEPSIQGGHGGIWIYDSDDDSTLAENIDYEEFNETTLDIACDSKNKKEFMNRYESYLESLI